MSDDTTPKTDPWRRWQVQIFTATWLAYVGYYFCRKAFYVVKADMAEGVGMDSTELAHVGTAYLAGYMVGQFSSASFGRLLGPKLLLLLGMGISLLCNAVFGAANSFWTVAVFMAVNGMAQGTGWPGCIGSLAYWFRRKQRGSILGVWSTCYQLGSVVASSFAAYILGHYGWRYSFFGATVALLLVWLVVFFLHPDRPEKVGLAPLDDPDEGAGGAGAPTAGQEEGLGWNRDVVVTILTMGTIYFCIKFLRYALWSWAPYFLQKNFSLQGDDAGYVSTVFDICGFCGVIVAGFASDKWFKGKRALISLIMVALMTVSFALMAGLGAQSVVLFSVTMGMAGFMLFGPDSLLSGAGAIDVGSRKGALAAAGIINGMGSIGPVFQEQIVGWMYKAYDRSLTPVLLMLLSMSLLCTVLTFVLYRRARQGKANI
jgi:sugar phosphate permease